MDPSSRSEALVDAFDERYAADELLEEWVTQEAQTFLPGSIADTLMPSSTRENSMAFMAGLARSLGMSHGCCLQLANLFDLYCIHALKGKQFPSLTTCIALVRLVKKSEKVNNPGQADTGPLLQIAARFYPSLQTTDDEVSRQELAVLQALGWRLYLPSIQSWLEKFVIRLNVLTNDVLAASLAWILEKILFPATVLVMMLPTTSALPPQRQARGLLGFGLASAGLLPLYELWPICDCHERWEQLFIRSGLMGLLGGGCSGTFVPPCSVPPEHHQQLLKMFEVACVSTLTEVREDCRDVALQLSGALAGGHNVGGMATHDNLEQI